MRKLAIPILLACILVFSGCEMMKSRGGRTAGGAGFGALAGAALGAGIGAATGSPGLGAAIGAAAGAVTGAAVGALWPDEGTDDEREALKIAAMGYMPYEQLTDVLVRSRLSPEWQNQWVAQAGTLQQQAQEMGKKIRFIVKPGVGLDHVLIDERG